MSKNGAAAEEKLPVHGFVLAGGKSSRMGVDKALLEFCGRPLVEIAVEKLRGFCAAVSIVGERPDLSEFAPVVTGERADCGPGAGIEAGLKAAMEEWCLFVPVDVPLVPGELLKQWAQAVMERARAGCGASFLLALGNREPGFSLIRREGLGAISDSLSRGQFALERLLYRVDDADIGWLWVCDAARCSPKAQPTDLEIGFWFQNLNTSADFDEAELWAQHLTVKNG